MKVTKVTYAMLRVTKAYENDRAEITVELDEEAGDTVAKAVKHAKRLCEKALKTADYKGF